MDENGMSVTKETVDKEKLKRLAEDPQEKELTGNAAMEIAGQFHQFLNNYKQMVKQYPLLSASTCLVAQLRIFGQEAATVVCGGGSQVHEAITGLMSQLKGGC